VLLARPRFGAFLADLFGPGRDAIEQELVDRARNGDASAFREIFDRFAPAVHRFSRDLLRSAVHADEATQETFVRALDRLGKLRDRDRLLAWLLGIAKKVCFEQLRRSGRDRDRHVGSEVAEACAAPFNPESAALDREAAGVVHAAIEALGAERRTALLLRFDHALPYSELAVVMGWSVAKAKVEVHRARLQLREALDAYERGDP
jgi:RNA polymerase sigma-70 factor (ECF subfamily)